MFTSDTEKLLLRYGGASAFCLLFAMIYARYSHGVSSAYMTCAFLIPLAGGILLAALRRVLSAARRSLFCQLIFGAVVWLTLGSLFRGALEIYGTTNRLRIVFPVAGAAQLLAAFALLIPSGRADE